MIAFKAVVIELIRWCLSLSYVRVRSQIRPWTSRGLVVLLLVGLFLALGGKYVSPVVFGDDEADYMSAAQRGFLSNYVDKGVISLATFVKKGIALGFKSERRSALSAFIRESGDIGFQRHYHGPLYFYWISLAHALGADDESTLRWASYLLLAVTAALAALLARELAGGEGGLAEFIAALMTLACAACAATAAQLTPHALYVPLVLAALYAMARWIRQPDSTRLTIVGVTLGFALVTMEYAALLVAATILLYYLLQRTEVKAAGANGPWRMIGRLMVTALATVFVLWPGGLLKLSLLKNYIFFGYFAIVRGGEYGTANVMDVWARRFAHSPVEYFLILLGVGYYITRLRRDQRYWALVSYVALVLLTTFRNTSPLPTYVASMLPPLYVLCGVALERLLGGWPVGARRLAVAAVSGLIIVNGWRALPAEAAPQRDHVSSVVAYFKTGGGAGRILVPRTYLPSLHYYYPTLEVASYSESDGLADLAGQALDSGYAGLLYTGYGREGFGHFLPQERIERIDTIAIAPTIPLYTLYYQLRR
jgi:dolichyl-phosphate-mannose-protein mannosyltransferase